MFVLLPVVILQFLGGTVLYTQAAPVMPALQSYWLVVHVTTVSIASGLLFVPGIASVLFLLRTRRTGCPPRWPRSCPSADALDRLAYRVTIVAFPLYTFAVIAGAIWAEAAWGRFWGWDPKETVAFVAWVDLRGLPARPRDRGLAQPAAPRGSTSWASRSWSSTCSSSTSWSRPALVRRGELRGRTRPRLDHRVVARLPSASEEGLGGFVWGAAGWTNDGA